MNKLISLLVYNRPHYLKQVLASLEQCKGIENYRLLVSIEKESNPECDELVKQADFCEKIVYKNLEHYGCSLATLFNFERAFEISDTVIALEDDILLAQDALPFFEQTLERYEKAEEVLCLSGFNYHKKYEAAHYFSLFRQQHYTSWGCGYWRDKFNSLIKQDFIKHEQNETWDTEINRRLFLNGKYWQVRPCLSRVQNIGAFGNHIDREDNAELQFFLKVHHTPIWSNWLAPRYGRFEEIQNEEKEEEKAV